MPTIILDEKLKINRDKFINFLNKKGIMARPFYSSGCQNTNQQKIHQ